jgi:hypothetical protein
MSNGLESNTVAKLDSDALAYIAITRLQNEYADVVSRRAWDEVDDLFTDDSNVRLNLAPAPPLDFPGRGGIGPFIAGSIERFEFFQFVILNATVHVRDENSATGRMYMSELRQDAVSGGWSTIHGVYHDTYGRDPGDGKWRFADRQYQSLRRSSGQVIPFPAAHLGPLS